VGGLPRQGKQVFYYEQNGVVPNIKRGEVRVSGGKGGRSLKIARELRGGKA